MSELVVSGAIYSFVYAFNFNRISVKSVFPLVMLFLFLIVLSEVPERAYTLTLIFTVRLLVVFRGLMLILTQIQNADAPASKSELGFVVGLTIELALLAVLLYSTFKFLSPELLKTVHFLSLKLFLVFSMPLIFQRLSFKYEPTLQ